jgi:thiol-disulfide isomerase/thioredoxin
MFRDIKIFVVVVLLLIANPFTGNGQHPETLKTGSQAPDFNLKGVDGKMYSLKSFASSPILAVVFTCNHCPTAQAYEERIKKITADYKGKKVAVVAITSNDPKAIRLDELGYTDLSDTYPEMKIRARDMNYNFPYLYDGDDQKTALAYGPLPLRTFLYSIKRESCVTTAGSMMLKSHLVHPGISTPEMPLKSCWPTNPSLFLRPRLLGVR